MLSTGKTRISAIDTLVSALEGSFAQFESGVAIDSPECRLTYADLDNWTSDLALQLRSRCNERQLKSEPIAILMSRSVEFYAAQIAVLRAGGFFLPIDPKQPNERIEFLLSDSQASVLLVRDADSFAVPELPAISFSIDFQRWNSERQNGGDRATLDDLVATGRSEEVGEEDLAYMIYTSGSSGQPKGVPVAHRSICNLCHWWANEFEIGQNERTLQMLSVGFDASLEEIFPTLITGGTLVPVQPDALKSVEQFVDFILRQRVNHLHLPTAFWHILSASFEMRESLDLPDSVRTVVIGGEKVDPEHVKAWFSRIGSAVRLINAYGPTETTVAASYAVLKPDVPPSIGSPIHRVSFCVVGKNGQLVESGQPGELYIGGVGVAAGYWKREQLSAEKFVDSPLNDGLPYYRTGDVVRLRDDGNYEFIGRIDNQIKLRGYRIEPGEISTCLRSHPQVGQAHVVARQLSSTNKAQQLVGYVVAKSDEEPDELELQEFLGERLPAYMVPSRVVLMDSFPVTAGGKLDLGRFPAPALGLEAQQDGESQWLTATEQKVGEVWEDVLGTGRLRRDANFFQIGGDSLMAMRLVLTLESKIPGPVIPVAALIPNPTIASMADYMDRRQHEPETESKNWPLLTRLGNTQQSISVVCLHAAGGGGMFYRQLFEGLESAPPIAVLEAANLYQNGPVVCEGQTIVEMAQDYVDCLIDAGCEEKLTLVGYSFGCLLAFEMTRLLNRQGYAVERIINIDSPNPQTMKPRNRFSRFWCRFQSPGTLSERIAEFKNIIQRKRRIKELEKLKKQKLPPPLELRSLALELGLSAIAESYVPDPNDISMHLICGEYPDAMYHIPEDYGWTEKVSKLTSIQIPGGHNTMFTQPYLRALNEAFHAALAE